MLLHDIRGRANSSKVSTREDELVESWSLFRQVLCLFQSLSKTVEEIGGGEVATLLRAQFPSDLCLPKLKYWLLCPFKSTFTFINWCKGGGEAFATIVHHKFWCNVVRKVNVAFKLCKAVYWFKRHHQPRRISVSKMFLILWPESFTLYIAQRSPLKNYWLCSPPVWNFSVSTKQKCLWQQRTVKGQSTVYVPAPYWPWTNILEGTE